MSKTQKIAVALLLFGILATVFGYTKSQLQQKEHANNPFYLDGSPLGRTASRLTQRTVDQIWESGEDSRGPVYPSIPEAPLFGNPLTPFKKASFFVDNIHQKMETKTYKTKKSYFLKRKLQVDLKDSLEEAFKLDRTSGPNLEMLLFYHTELGQPQLDTLPERKERVKEVMGYIDSSMAAYNLEVPEGNPDNHASAANAEVSRFNILTNLDPEYDQSTARGQELREKGKKALKTKIKEHLKNALICQEWHQKNGTWNRRSPYRKQDFWTLYSFSAVLGANAGGDIPMSKEEIIEKRLAPKGPEWAPGTKNFTNYYKETFGTIDEVSEIGKNPISSSKKDEQDRNENDPHYGHNHGSESKHDEPEYQDHHNHDHGQESHD